MILHYFLLSYFLEAHSMPRFSVVRMPLAAEILSATLMFLGLQNGVHAQDSSAGHRLVVEGEFAAPESRADRKPRGISGMACLGQGGDKKRECLTVNDEELSAEIVTLQDDSSPRSHEDAFYIESKKAPVVLVPREDQAISQIVGVRPTPATANCPEPGGNKFKELDGEGIALADGYIYVSGSHACSRDGKFKPSTFLLTRFKTASADTISGGIPPTVELTWRLGEVLPPIPSISGSDKLEEFSQKQRNIEGIAAADGRLYAGLRTPNVGGDVLIVSAPVDELFATGGGPLPVNVVEASKAQEIRLHFNNAHTGVRDIAPLKDNGGLLILTGPTATQDDVSYDLYWMKEFKPQPSLEHLLTIPTGLTEVWDKQKEEMQRESEKAETVTILSESPGKATVLVLFDNVDEGRPTQFDLALPPAGVSTAQ
jgi:hypothetical protein